MCHPGFCQNTLNVALGEKARAQFKVRHTSGAAARIQSAHEALKAFAGDVRTVEEKLRFLATRKLTRLAYENIVNRLFPVRTKQADTGEDVPVSATRRDNILSEIVTLYEDNDGGTFPKQAGTPYALLNAITNYTDHSRSSKGDGRAESALFGSGDKLKSSALKGILAESRTLPQSIQTMPSLSLADSGLTARC